MIFTVGHSNHPLERFLGLLRQHAIGAVADVRSTPFSRRNPHFSREPLRASLEQAGVAYVPLGMELGARAADPALYDDEGRVDFERLAATPPFASGVERVLAGEERYRLALLCAEKEPLDCHRTLLVARALHERGAEILHILADGGLEPHPETETRLLRLTGCEPPPLLDSPQERAGALLRAYRVRGRAIAYRRP